MKFYTLICMLVAIAFGQTGARAEETAAKPPSQLNGKSIVISYLETRKAKPEEGGEISTRKVPFKVIVYASAEGNLFNRLFAGSSGKSSDQTSRHKGWYPTFREGHRIRQAEDDGVECFSRRQGLENDRNDI